MVAIPDAYRGREQAYVKHRILGAYLERLFMIVGQSHSTINYVDCFAGPWSDESSELSGTSIAISLNIMEACRQALFNRFGRQVAFRALYIEKDDAAHQRLSDFLDRKEFDTIETKHIHGNLESSITDILDWAGSHFTYFFFDPKGWKELPAVPALLTHPHCELFINFMYEFLNRAVTQDAFLKHMEAVLGSSPEVAGLDSSDREATILAAYKQHLKGHHKRVKNWITSTQVFRPGTNKLLYHLIYLTSSARGVQVFLEESEKLEMVKHQVLVEVKQSKKKADSGMDDLFGFQQQEAKSIQTREEAAKALWMKTLSSSTQAIGLEQLADMHEESGLFLSEIQKGFKTLADEGLVCNVDADISRRRKHFIKFDANRGAGEHLKKISD